MLLRWFCGGLGCPTRRRHAVTHGHAVRYGDLWGAAQRNLLPDFYPLPYLYPHRDTLTQPDADDDPQPDAYTERYADTHHDACPKPHCYAYADSQQHGDDRAQPHTADHSYGYGNTSSCKCPLRGL